MNSRLGYLISLTVCLGSLMSFAEEQKNGGDKDTGKDQSRINALIKQLGSESYTKREDAVVGLANFGVKAKEALDQAIKSEDPEVRMRTTRLLIGIELRALEKEWISNLGKGHWAPFAGDARGVVRESAEDKDADKTEKVELQDKDKRDVFVKMVDKKVVKESAVDASLRWLAKHQEADGHWDSKKYGADKEDDISQTGFALLAFLGAGHTEKVGKYKNNVSKATAWFRALQQRNGGYARGPAVDGMSHALAGLAMAEAAGMGRVPATIASAQKAVNYTNDAHVQHASGKNGVGRAARSSNPDTITTTFYTMHLKSAKVAGLGVPPKSFDSVIKYFDDVEDKEKLGFRIHRKGKVFPEATLAALLSRQFLGWKKAELEPMAAKAVAQFGGPTMNKPATHPITNYLGTLVIFQQGGELWKKWHAKMKKELVDAQRLVGDEDGSWDPCGRQAGMGRVGFTAVNTLCLEVYYRYLPMYK